MTRHRACCPVPAVPWSWARRSRRSGRGRGYRDAAAGDTTASIAPAVAMPMARSREGLVARESAQELGLCACCDRKGGPVSKL